jgi:pimeloyl-ACP methyl ester carboxylesterase
MQSSLARIGPVTAAALALALPMLLGTGSCQKPNPIVFVHGASGSGAQFESQAMRFTSNGYPPDRVRVLEYDSSALNLSAVHAALDALIAELQAQTGATQIDLMGHSLGTTVSQAYLATPARAANVAHYVNIDGATASALPGGVPTLALWAGTGTPGRQIVGATNVTLPDHSHVECATSEEAFAEMFEFLRGRPPLTTKIIPEIRPRVSGRVTNFPQNTGLDGATLAVWVVDGDTGERVFDHPQETFAIGLDGTFGPFKGWFGVHYELEVTRPGEVAVNYFYEPFLRSDGLVRLNVALGLAPFITSGPNHVALSVVRFREFWGDRGAQNDTLEIDGTNVINPTVFATTSIGASSVAYFAFDTSPVPPPAVGPPDGITNLTYIPFPFGPLAFLTASDLVIPTDPAGSVAVHVVPRGVVEDETTVHVPNLPSSTNRVVVQLRDFEQ